mmetsp:Transcript_53235/g.86209  ORF Transcript_53235/g.86209 Transcript_53235/m.86209 type:complete len:250 (+) Transcript_53235:221-970(+)
MSQRKQPHGGGFLAIRVPNVAVILVWLRNHVSMENLMLCEWLSPSYRRDALWVRRIFVAKPWPLRRSNSEARVAKECIGRGVAASKFLEHLRSSGATTHGQNGIAKAHSGLLHLVLIVETSLLEGSKTVGAQHLSPLVTVVARRVSSSKYVRKATQKSVVLQRLLNLVGLGDFLVQVVHCLVAARLKPAVQLQVSDGELELTHHHRASTVVLGGLDLVPQVDRDGFSSFIVLGHLVHGGLVVAPVLHEL